MLPSKSDDRGVSQVVATVLVVAIVVVLGSTIGYLFLDIADEATQEPVPQASFSYVQNGNALTITHEAGDPIPAEELAIAVNEAEQKWNNVGSVGRVSAGKSAQLTISGKSEIKVIWRPTNSDQSAVLSTQAVTAPANPTFEGSNDAIKSTNDDGSYLGFGNKRLESDGYSAAGHLRIAPYQSSGTQLQVREATADEPVIASTGYSPSPGTHSFTLVYDGSTFKLTAGGQTVETSAFSVEEDAITIQVKKADSNVDVAKVSNLKIDGASVGSPDEITVNDKDQKSLLLTDGSFDDGFTLTGEFTFTESGPVSSDEAFVVRFDIA